MSTTTTTNHGDDEEEQDEPKLTGKELTMERIRLLRANGAVFLSYGDPDPTVFDSRGGLKQRGTFGRSSDRPGRGQ